MLDDIATPPEKTDISVSLETPSDVSPIQTTSDISTSLEKVSDIINDDTNEELPLTVSASRESQANHGPLDENDHKYVGLVNQAMTCYLNSLIQSLYMTPEFRNAIYKWNTANGKVPAESSILYQIQKLFLLLQTMNRDAIETTDLTASFGWKSNEAYDQQDVQEFRGDMLSKVELLWKGTSHEKLIENLYRGTMQDVVRCLACGKENIKEDHFFDLPLALKTFDGCETYKSVEDALSAFITPEKLDGSNQYHCEQCGGKRDASKGLRITQFPYLLTLQLKRFDFNYSTMHKLKLNDKMTFPDILNLNPFVYQSKGSMKKATDAVEEIKEEDEATHVGQPLNVEEVTRYLKDGEYVYELYSIMVHQGNASGGHYFAYIKNLEQDKWYIFNDSCVDTATSEEMERTFGGGYGRRGNTNAYMLMYRKIDKKMNEQFLPTDELPAHVIRLQRMWIAEEEERQELREYEARRVIVTLKLNFPCYNYALANESRVVPLQTLTAVDKVVEQGWTYFQEKASLFDVELKEEELRLILYKEKMYEIPSSKYNELLGTYLTQTELALDSKELTFLFDFPYQQPQVKIHRFPIASEETSIAAYVSFVNVIEKTVSSPFLINIDANPASVNEVRRLISKTLGDERRMLNTSRLVLQTYSNYHDDFLLLEKDDTDLRQCPAVMPTPHLYYDGGCLLTPALEADRRKAFDASMFSKILYKTSAEMHLKARLPSQKDCMAVKQYTKKQENIDSDWSSDDDDVIMADGNESRSNTLYIGSNLSSIFNNNNNNDNNNSSSLINFDSLSDDNDIREDQKYRIYDKEVCFLTVERSITTDVLKKWLAKKLKVDPLQIMFRLHDKDDFTDRGTLELSIKERLHKVFYISRNVDVLVRPALKSNEKLIMVHNGEYYNKCYNKDIIHKVFEVAVANNTSIKEFILRCRQLLSIHYRLVGEPHQINVGTYDTSTGVITCITDEEDVIENYWDDTVLIFVKGLDSGCLIHVQQVHSSDSLNDEFQELFIPDAKNNGNHWELVKKTIEDMNNSASENIELAEPTEWGYIYPDGSVKPFSGVTQFCDKKPKDFPDVFLSSIGERVIYYREKIEEDDSLIFIDAEDEKPESFA